MFPDLGGGCTNPPCGASSGRLRVCQLPLVSLSRTPLMRYRKTLGNALFWAGVWTGPSFVLAIRLCRFAWAT